MNVQTSQYFPNLTAAIAFLEGSGYAPTVSPKVDLTEWIMRPRHGIPVLARILPHGGGVTVSFELKADERVTYGHESCKVLARRHLTIARAVLTERKE